MDLIFIYMTEFEKGFLKFCDLLKSKLVPVKTEHPKIRIGEFGDGGYVCVDLYDYDYLYSLGSDDNIKFEKSFYEKYNKQCFVYDHTIDSITNKPDYIHFFKKGVGPQTTLELDTFDNLILKNGHSHKQNMMAQIDIEGYEWAILKTTNLINNFSQIIIEFHIPPNCLQVSDHILSTLDFMNERFYIVHIHGNNCLLSPWLDINLPRVFEVTYVRKDLVKEPSLETETFPIEGLDTPNDVSKPDMTLNWWSFKK